MSTIDITPELLDEAKGIILEVAPELGEAPLYLLAELPPDYPKPPFCHAFTPQHEDLLIRAHLEANDKWEGAGTIIALVAPPSDAASLLGTLLHEAAHNLPFAHKPHTLFPTPQEIKAQRTLAERYVALAGDEPPEPKWDLTHGPRFNRVCCHLYYRAVRAGYNLLGPGQLCFAGSNYCMSEPGEYIDALGDEPQHCCHLPFATILACTPPEAFTDLLVEDFCKSRNEWSTSSPSPWNES